MLYVLRFDYLVCSILENVLQSTGGKCVIPHLLGGILGIQLLSQLDLWYALTQRCSLLKLLLLFDNLFIDITHSCCINQTFYAHSYFVMELVAPPFSSCYFFLMIFFFINRQQLSSSRLTNFNLKSSLLSVRITTPACFQLPLA